MNCGITHHPGCTCHEQRHADEIARLRETIESAWQAFPQAGCVRGLGGVDLADVVADLVTKRDDARASEAAAVERASRMAIELQAQQRIAADADAYVRRRDVTIADLRAQVAEMSRGLTDLATRCERAESERDAATARHEALRAAARTHSETMSVWWAVPMEPSGFDRIRATLTALRTLTEAP